MASVFRRVLRKSCWRHCLAHSTTTIVWRSSPNINLPSTTNMYYLGHLPRVAKDYSRTLRLPYLRTETGPEPGGANVESAVLACYESNHPRRLAEEYILRLFGPLPYSLATAIACNNEQHFLQGTTLPRTMPHTHACFHPGA